LTLLVLVVTLVGSAAVGQALAQDNPPKADGAAPAGATKSLIDYIKAGGWIGHTIIALSFVGVALVIDSYVHVRAERLLPAAVWQQADQLARKGRFSDILTLCQGNESMFSRIVRAALAQGQLGIEAVRETMQESGTREVTRLQHRVGYLGFIASASPLLGLLGTVVGMISSFAVLGSQKGAARPDQLASGIAVALVTTCEGLIVAIPMLFFHNLFRDRVTRIGQEASGLCERLLRVMTTVIAARAAQGSSAVQPGMPAQGAVTHTEPK
jgi:biopolymer transport protein ExbB